MGTLQPPPSTAQPDPAAGPATLHLRVHPSVVFKLGEDLITDDVQALVELVKNAYDADSATVRITIDTQIWTDPLTGDPVSPPPDIEEPWPATRTAVRGLLEIVDRGDGMSRADIERGWLTVSLSPKRVMKAEGRVTRRRRTPLGDKGLGRLGAQRLGEVLELDTVPRDGNQAFQIAIPWRAFDDAAALDDVDLPLIATPRGTRRPGSTLRIRGLRQPERWRAKQLDDLQKDLSTMISPFGAHHGFEVTLNVDGEPIDLRGLPQQVRAAAQLTYRLRYASGLLAVDGQISTRFLRPDKESELGAYQQLVEEDNGVAFLDWLIADNPAKAANIGLTAGDERFFARVHQTFRLADLAGVQTDEKGSVVDPGPFTGEVDHVGLRESPSEAFSSLAEYRTFVRDINGVKVYRDGFGVRLDRDWLGLAARWTGGTSYYNLRPENVIGFIDLTAAGNAALVETTNREGFQDTDAFRNFMLLLERWRGFTEQTQGVLRRGFVAYRHQHLAATAHVPRATTPTALVEQVSQQMTRAHNSAGQARDVRAALSEVTRGVEQIRADQEHLDTLPLPTAQTEAIKQAVSRVADAAARADELARDLENLSSSYADQKRLLDLLAHQIRATENQLADAWEAVALGLAAEALSHEVHQIADRLRGRSSQLIRYLDDQGLDDLRVRGYVEHVRSSAAALNRQLAHLNPALRYMRERREDLVMSAVLTDVTRYFENRWTGTGLSISIDTIQDFTVHMNAGKLTQVFDNLVLNSEYWLREQQRRTASAPARVDLRVDVPVVTLTDTGPGVDPAVEDLLFDAFITTKNREQGRGLGLFVVRQLLDADGATIELDPHRSPDGRRRQFRLTFDTARRTTSGQGGAMAARSSSGRHG